MKEKQISKANDLKIFIEGAVSPSFIADSIAKHQQKTTIGAHSIFLGQVRSDAVGDQHVVAIEYTAFEEMAKDQMKIIREELFEKYSLTCMHVYQSLGIIKPGEICLFIFTSSPHRKAAIDACNEMVE